MVSLMDVCCLFYLVDCSTIMLRLCLTAHHMKLPEIITVIFELTSAEKILIREGEYFCQKQLNI
jgi:hypothetical protein